MEEMRGSQGRQETRHMSKGPGVGKTSDNEETAEASRTAAASKGEKEGDRIREAEVR